MARVLFGTNYSMQVARSRVAAGDYPRQHLWGAAELERAGHDVTYLPWAPDPRSRLGRLWPEGYHFGSSRAQWTALTQRRRYDVIYGGDPQTFEALARLRYRRRWQTPLVATIHPTADSAAAFRPALRGYDVTLAFSHQINDILGDVVGRDPAACLYAPWGPDLDWERYVSAGATTIVSTGRTHRDHRTLFQAVTGLGLGVRVQGVAAPTDLDPRDAIVLPDSGYGGALEELANARFVVIPLANVSGTFGVTELNDCLALGKAVVMTRNPHVDVDVDAIGCGISVPIGDARALRAAVKCLADDVDRTRLMGARGRAFAEATWNAEAFGQGLVRAVGQALRSV